MNGKSILGWPYRLITINSPNSGTWRSSGNHIGNNRKNGVRTNISDLNTSWRKSRLQNPINKYFGWWVGSIIAIQLEICVDLICISTIIKWLNVIYFVAKKSQRAITSVNRSRQPLIIGRGSWKHLIIIGDLIGIACLCLINLEKEKCSLISCLGTILKV